MSFELDETEFKFSIIMALYNTELYLKKTIESVINQSIGFKKNVELIIVDDGSLDKSYETAKLYEESYPQNIKVIRQEHNGTASARNNGLRYATGKYITFLDSDDYYSKETLKNVYSFFEKNYEEVDLVSIPMNYFGKKKGEHELNYKYSKTGIIDLEENPNNPQISISSTFIKNSKLKESPFKEDILSSEDTLYLNKILLDKMKYGVVKNAKYFYQKRYSLNSTSNNIAFNKNYYIPRLKEFFMDLIQYNIKKTGEVNRFIQYTIIYELQKIIKQENIEPVLEEDSENEFKCLLNEIISYLDDEVILDNKNLPDSFLKNYVYYLKYNDLHPEYIKDKDVELKIEERLIDTLSVHKFWISNVNIVNKNLIIEGDFSSYFNTKHLSIEALVKTNDNDMVSYFAYLETDLDISRKFLSNIWQYRTLFKIEIPLDENSKDIHINDIKIRINYHKNKDNTDFNKDNLITTYLPVDFKSNALLFKRNENFIKENFMVSFKNQQFHTTRLLYNFSVIMAVYNTQEYLREAIESIINQTLDFKENIELIIVDDGSTDSSKDIALEYQKEYPENIIVLSQENSGQSVARNYGIKEAHGRYINFLDSDDYIDDDAFEKAYKFFDEHINEVDIVSIPIIHFGRSDHPHILNYKFEETKVIDLIEEPNNPQLSSPSAFFKRELLDKFQFPTDITFSEDAVLINKILLEKKKLGVISNTYYHYRKREDYGSTIDSVSKEKEFYTDKLKYYFLELIEYAIFKEKKVAKFLQYMIIYDLHYLIKVPKITLLEKKLELDEFWYYIEKIIPHIDADTIYNNEVIKNRFVKNFLLSLKWKELHPEIIEDNVILKNKKRYIDDFSKHKIWIDIVEIKDNILNLSGVFASYFDTKYISVEAVKNKNNNSEQYPAKQVNYTSRKNREFLSNTVQYKYSFDVSIPLENDENCDVVLRVNFHEDGNSENFDKSNVISNCCDIKFRPYAKMSEISSYIVKDNYLVKFDENNFHVTNYSYAKMFSSELNVQNIIFHEEDAHLSILLTRLLFLIAYPIVKKFSGNKAIYLFMDRIDVGDDNAKELFEYASKEKDDVKKYFVLSNKSKNYKEISRIGKVINHHSFKHRFLTLFAEKIISSNPYENIINPFFSKENDERKWYNGLIRANTYFLQHGVTFGNISEKISKYNNNLSLITTVSDVESESFKKDGYNYDEKIIQTLGFPRYDKLTKENTSKQILIIPTWRKNYKGKAGIFLASEYYKKLNNLLTNDNFIKLTQKYGYKIIFKAHPELEEYDDEIKKKYVDLLEIDENIEISRKESFHELINKSDLMITDYSSVSFDFCYLKKPVIYYQLDDKYDKNEYYFDLKTKGFGDFINDEKSLMDKIEYYLENECEMEEKYKRRVDEFFKFKDKNNSKRVYEWIKNN